MTANDWRKLAWAAFGPLIPAFVALALIGLFLTGCAAVEGAPRSTEIVYGIGCRTYTDTAVLGQRSGSYFVYQRRDSSWVTLSGHVPYMATFLADR